MSAVSPDDMTRLLNAVAEAGGVDELLRRSVASTARSTKAPAVAFRTVDDVLNAIDAGLITRAEGRKLLGHRGTPPAIPRRSRS